MTNKNSANDIRRAANESGSRFAHALIAACALILLASCATPYQAGKGQSGYTDQRIDDSTYTVSYQGDGNTGSENVWNYWMYRCAELTLEKGFAYFSIIPKARLTSDTAAPILRPAIAYANSTNGAGGFVQTKGGGVTYYSYSVPYTYTIASSSATIKLHRDPLRSNVLIAINAAKLKELLAPVIAGKPRELSRQALLASVAIFNDKAELANLESATGTPIIVNNIEELRVIANRDLVPAALNGNVAANTAPIAKKFAAPKRQIAELTTVIQQEFKSDGDKKREPATVIEQFVHHPVGYTTIATQTMLSGGNKAPGLSAHLSIGGIVSVRSAYTASLFAKSANTLDYGSQYVVQAMSGELAKPVGTISFTTRSFVDKNGTEQRTSSDANNVTTSCDAGETKPASNLHPGLQGNAIRITCKASFGGRPSSDSVQWFLEDYQWYVRESEKWATGSSMRTIKDVRFSVKK